MPREADKLCKKCGVIKPRSEFAKNKARDNGISSYCRECEQKRVNEWRTRTGKSRGQYRGPHYVQVHRAVNSGKLVKPETCSICGSNGRIEAHHEDYSRPLDVIWVCCHCHKVLEGKISA
jgi:hypothetical protein